MERGCAICGTSSSRKNVVASYVESRQGPPGRHHEIPLCEACVERREVESWKTKTVTAQRMHTGLGRQEESPLGRYVYLEDKDRIRLVRLRAEWVAAHAVAVTS